MEFNVPFWVVLNNMKIKIVDTYGHPIKEMDHNFDSIMLEAEEKGETPFLMQLNGLEIQLEKMKVFRLMKVAIVTLTNIYVNMQLLDM